MKKKRWILAVIAGLLICLISIGFFYGVRKGVRYVVLHSSIFYVDAGVHNGFHIFEGPETCFVADYEWDKTSIEITIPDSFNGKYITSLGGLYGHGGGMKFQIIRNDDKAIYEKFILHIGSHINQIFAIDLDQISWIDCDEQNQTFYCMNGALYLRSDNSLVYDPAHPYGTEYPS